MSLFARRRRSLSSIDFAEDTDATIDVLIEAKEVLKGGHGLAWYVELLRDLIFFFGGSGS